jgi:L-fuconolactonase
MEPWAFRIRALALRPNVLCKVSGLVTEAETGAWTAASLAPYLDLITEAFTPARLLAASYWPVLLPELGYSAWWELLRDYFAAFSASEQQALFGCNAVTAYGLSTE